MKVYLAFSGHINKHGFQDYDMIGVFDTKDKAIEAVESSLDDVDRTAITTETDSHGNIFWTEHGMDIVTVGYISEHEVK